MDEGVSKSTFRQYWRHGLLLGLSVVVILLTVYCLQNGIQTVFTHIYYVPIILAAFWFQKRGVLYSAVISVFYFTCVVLLTGYNPLYIVAATARVIVFIIIAAVTAILSMRISFQQAEIRESEKKFHTVWEHIQAGIVLVDANTHEIIAANPEAERLTGYSENEMIGQTCHTFICPVGKGKCPISDLGQTVDRSERVVLNRTGSAVPVLKTVTVTIMGGRNVLIENFVAIPTAGTVQPKKD